MAEQQWWRRSVIYQLLVPSFFDSDDDGLGDLNGVTARLDYLQWVGADAVWLSPFHPSPLRELGYDVSDHCDVEPRFGSLEHFDRLIESAHSRGLRVILDWVANHTSAQHPWFRDSRSSRTSERRNWYLWRDPRPDGSPPNNWVSVFGGSAWQWDPATSQYYLHTFLDAQPDLNWREPAMKEAMWSMLEFWLDRGVDGFRIDAAALLIKDAEFRDNPPNPAFKDGDLPDSSLLPVHTRNQPGLHELFAEAQAVLRRYAEPRVLLGEFYVPVEELVTFYGDHERELDLPLNLSLTWTEWRADVVGAAIAAYQSAVAERGWPTTTLDTHDQPRIVARAGLAHARVAAMLLFTQRGTPTLYYGDEIGMRGVPIPAEQAVDPQGRRTGRNRDPSRTPMQWSSELHAGFSRIEPWLPISDDFREANVASQASNAASLLTLHRRLIDLRRELPILIDGVHEPLPGEGTVLAYRRCASGKRLLVVLNFAAAEVGYELGDHGAGTVLLSAFLDREGERVAERVALKGNEGLIIALDR